MNSINNTTTLSGFLTSKVNVSEHKGTPVANFVLVTNSPAGEGKPDIPMYHQCVLWGNIVDKVKDRLQGSPYTQVIGELRYKKVKDENGFDINKPTIHVREIKTLNVQKSTSN